MSAGLPDAVAAIASAVREGVHTAEQFAARALDRIDTGHEALNAFTQVFHDDAMASARSIDARRRAGEALGPLAGVPVAIKDNICTVLGRTTCASRMLRDYRSPFNAGAVERLLEAGAVIVGKTNMDEFAMGSSGEHSCFGPTRNPHNRGRVPGGSSSGSACAVGAGMVPLALGSDTGGSIRQPAAHCGVVGAKPTYGRVSRWGLVAFASSLDQIGPLTATAADASLAMSVLCARDERDSTSHEAASWKRAVDPNGAGVHGNKGPDGVWRVAVPSVAHGLGGSSGQGGGNHPGVVDAIERACDALRALGADVVECELPHADHGIAAYYIVATAEASSNLARYDGVRYGHRAELAPGDGLRELYVKTRSEGFGPEVQRRLMLGTHVLSSGYHDAYYQTALRARRVIKRDYDRVFDPHGEVRADAVLLPASPGPAFRLGAKLNDPLAMYLEDLYTVGVNLAGLPGVTVPAGWCLDGDGSGDDDARLPVGVQLIGDAFSDERLLALAGELEAALRDYAGA